jgi:hypothetical protein
MKTYGGVYLGTSWKCVVSFTPRPLYPQKKSPRYPMYRRLGGPRAGLDDAERRNILPLPGLELRPLSWSASTQSLSRLHIYIGLYVCVHFYLSTSFRRKKKWMMSSHIHRWYCGMLAWFRWEGQKERDHYEDLVGGGKMLKMDRRELGSNGVDWIRLAQDRNKWMAHVNTVISLRVSWNVGKFLSSWATGGFSRVTQPHGVS